MGTTPSRIAAPTAGHGDAAHEAWAAILSLAFAQRGRFVAAAAELDLSPMQAHALRILVPDRPVPMSVLAGALSCDASNVTGIVDRLERRGLIERRGSASDRRLKMLALTGEGAATRARLMGAVSSPPPELRSLTAEDQRALRDILQRAGC